MKPNTKPFKDIVLVIHSIFNRIISTNDKRFNHKCPESIFDLAKTPSLSLFAYMTEIIDIWEVERDTLISSLILIDRFGSSGKFIITRKNIFTVFIIALLISLKMHEDTIYSDTDFAKMAKISVSTMSKLEKYFLEKIEYKIFINNDTYKTYERLI